MVDLSSKINGFVTSTGIPLNYVVILNENTAGGPPSGADATAYATELGVGTAGFPVTADATGQLYAMTPWTGSPRPGKCALAPDMTILACYAGENDAEGFAAIQAHAAAQGM